MQRKREEIEVNFYNKLELRKTFIAFYKATGLDSDKRSELRSEIAIATKPENIERGIIRLNNVLSNRSNYEQLEWKIIFEILEKYDKSIIASKFFNTDSNEK